MVTCYSFIAPIKSNILMGFLYGDDIVYESSQITFGIMLEMIEWQTIYWYNQRIIIS